MKIVYMLSPIEVERVNREIKKREVKLAVKRILK